MPAPCTTAFPCALGPIPAGQSRDDHDDVPGAVELYGTGSHREHGNREQCGDRSRSHQQFGDGHYGGRPAVHDQCRDHEGGSGQRDAGHESRLFHTVTNNGTLDATDVTVTDPTPAGLTFVEQYRRLHDAVSRVRWARFRRARAARSPRPLRFRPAMPAPNPIFNTSTVTTTVADEDLDRQSGHRHDTGRRCDGRSGDHEAAVRRA